MSSPPTELPAPGQKPSWANQQSDDPISIAARAINAADLQLIDICAPGDEVDVNHHLARISIRTGLSRGKCSTLCEIALMFERLPKVRALIESTFCFSLAHLRAIANGVAGLSPDQFDTVEPHLLEMLTPTRPRQAMVGVYTLSRLIGDLVSEYNDCARNDGTQRVPEGEAVALADTGDGKHKKVTAILENDRATELMARIQGIRNTAINRGEQCTQAEALLQLAQNSTNAEIVINVYREVGGGPAWIDGVGWLSEVATEEWIARATHIRISADSKVDGYRPTESQVARVRGRDGTCRFPGCDVPAAKCDLDHIQPYNYDNPEQGGPTDTENLHCLCRRHHNLKTHEGWNIDRYPDGTEVWTSRDGDTATSIPVGPLKNVGKQTFHQRVTRKMKTIQKRNLDWMLSFCDVPDEVWELTEEEEKRIESLTDEELDAEIEQYRRKQDELLDGD
ncbi:HNH endonuclease signature motif containing protein [Corynebacterium sp. MSK151]|uniref:HNH endonuclease signature motif containing protein n=1 Tax=Corynebacterium TaxID=1716 RepID=UPI000C78A74A|nr:MULTISPECIES: HNH endonuclease signature motif containing protein [Corynebacterium]MBC6822150.1 HNH endonuclease [Corynebacterium sp. LK33]MDK7315093.1 HNH endonuclease signature motif containing protein [Corynebacterium amycolatum]MDK8758938.1 HNH endonuclease signature motif containing protein [Corynebacterium sp. MSK151]MDK8848079.1 HNH endonuclease signature motif containing protein [Corynebacterium sp. MSK047]PKZ21934.1 HNH endonuclease [Corynebacterium amycolatum]